MGVTVVLVTVTRDRVENQMLTRVFKIRRESRGVIKIRSTRIRV